MSQPSTSPLSMHKRKQPSPTRSLRHITDERERSRQGYFVYNPFADARPSRSVFVDLLDHLADSFSDGDGSPAACNGDSRRSRKQQAARDKKARSVSPRVEKVNPGPGTRILIDSYAAQAGDTGDYDPHRMTLFDALLKRKKVIPLPGRPGAPINIAPYPDSGLLTDEEFEVCCVLRLTPHQYFASRRTLIANHRKLGFYRKSAAQKMLKIDVNKTGKLYDFFQDHRWLPRDEYDQGYLEPPEISLSL